jgi:cation/acetate symporter
MLEIGSFSEQERASIDGRVSFGAAAFAVAAGLIILLDRVGVPARFVVLLGPAFALLGLSIIGLLLRSMRVSRFFAGARRIPASYAGLGIAAISLGLFLPFTAPLPTDTSLRGLVMGFIVGGAVALLLVGPMLRRTGAYSIADLLGARFPNAIFRLGVVSIVATVCALVAVAGLEGGARALDQALGIGRDPALLVVAIVLACITVFGGLAGVIWAATAAAGVLLFGFGLPIVLAIVGGGGPLPIPVLGDRALWARAALRIAAWGDVTPDQHMSDAVFLTLALGLAVFPPLLVGALTCRDRRAARRAGGAALLWQGIGCALVICTMAMVALGVDGAILGKAPDGLPVWAYSASARGDLLICGQAVAGPAAAKNACAHATDFSAVLRASDIVASGRYLVAGLASVRNFGPAFSGLTAAAVAVAALLLAAASLQAFATAIGHDVVYRLRHSGALTSRRLAVSRTVLVVSLAAAVTVLRVKSIDPGMMIALAIAVSAGVLAPVSLLALVGRIRSIDATLALFCGFTCAAVMIGSSAGPQTFNRLAVIALMVGLIVWLAGLILSFIGARASDKEVEVAHAILHGNQQILSPDRGA